MPWMRTVRTNNKKTSATGAKVAAESLPLSVSHINISDALDAVKDDFGDVLPRLILEKRYLSLLQWNVIAQDLGYSKRWLQFRRQEALEAVEKVMEEVGE